MEFSNLNGYDVKDKTARNTVEHKLEHYDITNNMSEEEIQNIFNIEKAKVISFKNDYTFTETKNLNSNTTILLNNHTLTFNVPSYVDDSNNSHGFFNFKSNDCFLGYNGNGNITIKDGTIIGGNCSFCHASNITFENINFELCKNNHILEMAGINNLLVKHCTFNGIAIPSDDSLTHEYIQTDYMRYIAFPWFDENSETYDGTINKNWYIENNKFTNPNEEGYTFITAIGTHSGFEGYNDTFENINIVGNEIIEPRHKGLSLYNIYGLNIKDNKFVRTDYTDEFEDSSMITLRYRAKDIKIENNIFDGNYSAISFLRYDYLKENVQIIHNIFKNYNEGTDSIVHVYNTSNMKVHDNIFNNFSNTAIRLDQQTTDEASNNYNNYFYDNKFYSQQTLNDGVIKLYFGIAHCYKNEFNIPNFNNKYAIYLPAIADDTLNSYHIYDNKFINCFNFRHLYLNGFSPETAFNIPFKLYEGNSNSITNQTPDFDIFKFNTLRLTIGKSGPRNTVILKPYTPYENINATIYKFSVIGTGTTVVGGLLTINSDGTFNYSCTEELATLRNIYAYNE